jgi:hypothetical protein
MVLFLQNYVLEVFYMELIEWFFEYHGALLPRVGKGRRILDRSRRELHFAEDRSRCCLDLDSHI